MINIIQGNPTNVKLHMEGGAPTNTVMTTNKDEDGTVHYKFDPPVCAWFPDDWKFSKRTLRVFRTLPNGEEVDLLDALIMPASWATYPTLNTLISHGLMVNCEN